MKTRDKIINTAIELFNEQGTKAVSTNHIASAVGAKTVGIFGPDDHWRFTPAVPEEQKRVVRRDIPECSLPCYKFDCGNPVCLDRITPEEVLSAAVELLENKGAA